MLTVKDLPKKQPLKELETLARAKKATPAASTAVFDTISRNCAILQRDVSTLVAKTRGSECLPENPCGVLWWPARALGNPFCHFSTKTELKLLYFDAIIAV